MTKKNRSHRRRSRRLNFNIWDNNGVWFFHRVVHPTPITKERIRFSLKTKDVVEARKRRDELLRQLANTRQPALPLQSLAA